MRDGQPASGLGCCGCAVCRGCIGRLGRNAAGGGASIGDEHGARVRSIRGWDTCGLVRKRFRQYGLAGVRDGHGGAGGRALEQRAAGGVHQPSACAWPGGRSSSGGWRACGWRAALVRIRRSRGGAGGAAAGDGAGRQRGRVRLGLGQRCHSLRCWGRACRGAVRQRLAGGVRCCCAGGGLCGRQRCGGVGGSGGRSDADDSGACTQ